MWVAVEVLRQLNIIPFLQFFSSLWNLVWSYIDFSSANSQHIPNHFVQFAYLTSGSKARYFFLQLIWLSYACVLCNGRNNRLIKNKENYISQLLDRVKLHFFWWMKATSANFVRLLVWVSVNFILLCFVFYITLL